MIVLWQSHWNEWCVIPCSSEYTHLKLNCIDLMNWNVACDILLIRLIPNTCKRPLILPLCKYHYSIDLPHVIVEQNLFLRITTRLQCLPLVIFEKTDFWETTMLTPCDFWETAMLTPLIFEKKCRITTRLTHLDLLIKTVFWEKLQCLPLVIFEKNYLTFEKLQCLPLVIFENDYKTYPFRFVD